MNAGGRASALSQVNWVTGERGKENAVPEESTGNLRATTVLVVEDEPVARQCLARLLQLQGDARR